MRNYHKMIPLNALMFKMAQRLPPTPRKPAKEKHKGQHGKTLLTDEQVLAFRSAHEFEGVSVRTLAIQYGLERDYARRLADYTVRSKLIPKRPKR